jgi:large subunit ribosomal protein L24
MKKLSGQQKRFRPKLKIKKGDTVKVLSGEYRGKIGEVLEVLPSLNKAVVKDINIIVKHTKPSAQHPNGGREEKEAPIHISNLQLMVNGHPTRVGRMVNEDGSIVRYSKKTKEVIE